MQNPSSPQTSSAIRDISDTALWVAVYRARESDRPDAVFRDPFARRLAGARGEEIAGDLAFAEKHAWAYTARTYLIDQFISREVEQGVDMVINLAAGLDTRPYRMQLPAALKWVEVDLPPLLEYKEEILKNDRPVGTLERIRLDLSDVSARRELFNRLGAQANKALVLTEGLLIYLTEEDVGALAKDLTAPSSFQRWIIDLSSPGLLRLLQKGLGAQLDSAGAPLKFGPTAGPEFFRPFGWSPADVRSLLHTAARLKRLSWKMRLLAMLPDSKGRAGNRPWGGICLLKRS